MFVENFDEQYVHVEGGERQSDGRIKFLGQWFYAAISSDIQENDVAGFRIRILRRLRVSGHGSERDLGKYCIKTDQASVWRGLDMKF